MSKSPNHTIWLARIPTVIIGYGWFIRCTSLFYDCLNCLSDIEHKQCNASTVSLHGLCGHKRNILLQSICLHWGRKVRAKFSTPILKLETHTYYVANSPEKKNKQTNKKPKNKTNKQKQKQNSLFQMFWSCRDSLMIVFRMLYEMKIKCRAYNVRNSDIVLINHRVVPYNVKGSELRFEAWKRAIDREGAVYTPVPQKLPYFTEKASNGPLKSYVGSLFSAVPPWSMLASTFVLLDRLSKNWEEEEEEENEQH